MNQKSVRVLILSVILLTVASFAASLIRGVVWTDQASGSIGLWNLAGAEDFMVVRVYFDRPEQVAELAAFTEPWEVDNEKGFVVLGVTGNEYTILQAMGFTRIEVDTQLTTQYTTAPQLLPGQMDGIPGFPCYRTVEETFQTMDDLVAGYPNLAQVVDAGDSWVKTQNASAGYDMRVLVLTNQSIPGPKPKIFITAAIHAREYSTAELATRFAEVLIAGYTIDPDITWLLDSHEIHLMLHANPDGRKMAEAGLLWRKNANNNYCSNTNSRGADLNRNFEYQWGCCGGSSGSQCSETYRGASAASEPEVQAVQNYMRSIFPDQKGPNPSDPAPADATGVYIDIHSYSELVLWSWGYTSAVAPNGIALQTLGRKLAWFNDYMPQQAIELYITDGTTDDFGYGDLGVAAYTYELGTSFFQDCGTFENVILPDNLASLMYAAKVARTPYLTPAGPDALDVQAWPAAVNAGDPVTLTATINDGRFNNDNGTEPVQNVVAAEYYIDVPYWITSTTPVAHPMSAADGNFNSSLEAVEAVVDTTGWSGGRHLVYVRGQDANGNWGVVGAQFIYVFSGNDGAFVGQLTDALTADPVVGAVYADSIGVSTLTDASGMYTLTLPAGTWNLRAAGAYHLDAFANTVSVSNGVLTQQDFVLDPTPGMAIEANEVSSFQPLESVAVQTLRIENPGNLPLDFSISGRDGGFLPAAQAAHVMANLSVLLVDDDDNSPNVRPYYTTALDTLGISYTVFDVGGGAGNGPNAATMAAYDAVIWFSGDQFGDGTDEAGPNATDEAQLAIYLDGGGALLLSSQDYHWDRGLTAFMTDYLGVGSIVDDLGDYSSVSGQNDFSGLGPYTLNEPGTDYSDEMFAGSGQLAFLGNNGNGAAVYTQNTAFLAFQWEGIANASAANGAQSLQALLDYLLPPEIPWLGIAPLEGTIPPNSYIDVSLTFSATAPIVTQEGLYTGTLTIRGNDPGNPHEIVAIAMHVGDVVNGTASGTVQLQGRSDHDGIEISALQGAVVVDTAVTNAAGSFSFSLSPGTYDIAVEMDGYLDGFKAAVSVTSGGTTNLGPLLLPAGDANDDGAIDVLDIAAIASRYGLTCSDSGYDPLADPNGDCVINIQDLSLAGGNFGMTSPVPW